MTVNFLLFILYIIVAPFASAFFIWAWGGLPENPDDKMFAVVFSCAFWPIFLVFGLALALVPKLEKLEKDGERK